MLATQLVTLLPREMLGHHNAVDVIGLMLQTACKGPCSRHSDGLAELILTSTYREVGPS